MSPRNLYTRRVLLLLLLFIWYGKASAHEFDLHLTWTDLADNEDGFEIERSATGENGPFEWIDTVGEDVTSYTDSGLTDHIPYCYRVRAFNAAGNSASAVACATGAVNSPPIANAGPDRIVLTGELVSFDGSGSSDSDGDSLSYAWAFGDGATASGTTPEHTYLAAGTYTVTLTVSDGSLSHTDSALITVDSLTNSVPVADAGLDQIVLVGETVSCDGSGSYDPDGDTLSYEWALGDGTMGSGVTDEHIYLEPGTYTVTLTVWDTEGLSNSDSAVVVVLSSADALLFFENFETYNSGQDPLDWKDTQAGNSFTADQSVFKTATVGGTMAFGTTSTQTNIHSHYQAAAALGWSNYTFTGRMYLTGARGGIGVTFLSQFPANQDHYYRLRRNNNNGTQDFHLAPHGTSVSGTTHSGVTPQANTWYQFRIKVEDTGSQTEIRAKVWQEGTLEPTSFQIEAVDASANRLTAGTVGVWSMADGGKHFDDLQVQFGTELPPPPSANRAPTAVLAMTPSSPVTVGTMLSFDGSGSSDPDGDTLSYEWALGDGAEASAMRSEHTYLAAGTYTVTLTVDDGELTDTDTAMITVVLDEENPCSFANLARCATASASSVWSASYAAARATDANEGTRWNSASGETTGAWLALEFTTPTTFDTIVLKEAFNRITSYRLQAWQGSQWVDLVVGTRIGASHTQAFAPLTAQRVRLLVTSTVSRKDTGAPTIYEFEVYNTGSAPAANQPPVADAGPAQTVTLGAPVTLDGTGSDDPEGDPLSYSWDFDDGTTTVGPIVTHTYTTAGSYVVTLTVDDGELSDTATVLITITAEASPACGFVNLARCATASASSVWSASYAAARAQDDNVTTRWNSANGDQEGAWLALEFATPTTFDTLVLAEAIERIRGYTLQYWDGQAWQELLSGTTIGASQTHVFPALTAQKVRVVVTDLISGASSVTPTLSELKVYNTGP